MTREHEVVQNEFERAASTFAERTHGRFDHMDVLGFSDVTSGATVAEVGAGTGNFLALFKSVASHLIAIDLTAAMLVVAATQHPEMDCVVADGVALPLASGSIDLVTTAQALHHIHDPLPVLKEMRRVCHEGGRVLVVDQVATENLEEALALNDLDVLRDPSHARCRPPSAFRIMLTAVGLEIEDEQIVESTERFSNWMSPEEFPIERIEAARRFITARGDTTGMAWRPDADDWTYTRRRIMLRARRGG